MSKQAGASSLLAVRLFLCCAIALTFLAACADPSQPSIADGPEPADTPAAPSNPSDPLPTDLPDDPSAISAAWEGGPHSETFVQTAEGSNSTCARCHAPVNWIPTMEEIPESCLTCKFEVDPPPPFITEDVWTHVECKVCHLTKKDNVEAEVAWLEIAPIEEYAQVSSITELCDKCHVADAIPEHASVQVSGDHVDYQCTQCHDPHDAKASCTSAGCHEDVLLADISGHDADHTQISCEACHDAGSMLVAPIDELGIWSTFVVLDDETILRQISHDIVREAPCERCHFAGNEWELSTIEQP